MLLLRTLQNLHLSIIYLIRQHRPLDESLFRGPDGTEDHINQTSDHKPEDPGEGVGPFADARVDGGGDAVDETREVGGDADEEGEHGAEIGVEGVGVDAVDRLSIILLIEKS